MAARTKSTSIFDWLLTLVFKGIIICVCVIAMLYFIGVAGSIILSVAHGHCSLSSAVAKHVGFWDYLIVIGIVILYFYYHKK